MASGEGSSVLRPDMKSLIKVGKRRMLREARRAKSGLRVGKTGGLYILPHIPISALF